MNIIHDICTNLVQDIIDPASVGGQNSRSWSQRRAQLHSGPSVCNWCIMHSTCPWRLWPRNRQSCVLMTRLL